MALFAFDNSYARLPDRFHARLPPTPVAAPGLVRINTGLAATLGDTLALALTDGVTEKEAVVEALTENDAVGVREGEPTTRLEIMGARPRTACSCVQGTLELALVQLSAVNTGVSALAPAE